MNKFFAVLTYVNCLLLALGISMASIQAVVKHGSLATIDGFYDFILHCSFIIVMISLNQTYMVFLNMTKLRKHGFNVVGIFISIIIALLVTTGYNWFILAEYATYLDTSASANPNKILYAGVLLMPFLLLILSSAEIDKYNKLNTSTQ